MPAANVRDELNKIAIIKDREDNEMMRENETWFGAGAKTGGIVAVYGWESVAGKITNLNFTRTHDFTIKNERWGIGLGGGAGTTLLLVFNQANLYELRGLQMEDWDLNISLTKGRLKDLKTAVKYKEAAKILLLAKGMVGNKKDIQEAMQFFYESIDGASSSKPVVITFDVPFAGAGLEVSLFSTIGTLEIDFVGLQEQRIKTNIQEVYEGPSQLTTKDDWMIVIPGDVLFDTNEFRIKPLAAQALNRAGARIRNFPQHTTIINGHTDSRAGDAYNKTLSEKRAAAVKQWLVQKNYVKESRVSTNGFGESFPVMPNTTSQNMEKNRRVEIFLVRNPPPPVKLPKDWYRQVFEPKVKLPFKIKGWL